MNSDRRARRDSAVSQWSRKTTTTQRLHSVHSAWTPVLLAVALASCVPAQPEIEACAAPAREQVVAQMYFGRNIGGQLGVSESQWAAFVDSEITPRFPDGLTVADAQGQWRDSETGAIVHEPSKQLTVFLADEAQGRAALAAIAAAYKSQFHQQAVALVVERSCVSFQ